MLWSICYAVGILLAIVGFVEIVQLTKTCFLRTKEENNFILLIPMKGHVEDAELLLRNAIIKVNYFKKIRNQKVICLDLGMDDETKEICNIMSIKYKAIDVLSQNEFKNFLDEI